MTVWFFGVALLVLAICAFVYMKHTRDELHAMIGTETLSIPVLEQYRSASDEMGGTGAFRKTAEVVGAAHPGPNGPLSAELSKTECVWYRYRIERHYETVVYRDGRRHRRRHTERVADHTSGQGYAVIDEAGRTIGVDPDGTKPDSVEQTVDRFEPYHGGHSMSLFGIQLPVALGRGSQTIGYAYKEWLIRPGQRLYVLGEVHDRHGPLVIGEPMESGHFIISTRTEQELRKARENRHKMLAFGVIATTVLGLGLLVGGLVG